VAQDGIFLCLSLLSANNRGALHIAFYTQARFSIFGSTLTSTRRKEESSTVFENQQHVGIAVQYAEHPPEFAQTLHATPRVHRHYTHTHTHTRIASHCIALHRKTLPPPVSGWTGATAFIFSSKARRWNQRIPLTVGRGKIASERVTEKGTYRKKALS
jgi:hypothetical protein